MISQRASVRDSASDPAARRRAVPLRAALVACLVLLASPATAAIPSLSDTPDPSESAFAREVQAAYWRDRTCETPGCGVARSASFTDVASFGLAIAGGIFLARRRQA